MVNAMRRAAIGIASPVGAGAGCARAKNAEAGGIERGGDEGVQREAGADLCDAGDFPVAEGGADESAAVPEERQVVNVAGGEDVAPIELGEAALALVEYV